MGTLVLNVFNLYQSFGTYITKGVKHCRSLIMRQKSNLFCENISVT